MFSEPWGLSVVSLIESRLESPRMNEGRYKIAPRTMEKTTIAKSFFLPGYILQFHGLRGAAILLVLIGDSGFVEALRHLGWLQYERFRVVLFFVFASSLIT